MKGIIKACLLLIVIGTSTCQSVENLDDTDLQRSALLELQAHRLKTRGKGPLNYIRVIKKATDFQNGGDLWEWRVALLLR